MSSNVSSMFISSYQVKPQVCAFVCQVMYGDYLSSIIPDFDELYIFIIEMYKAMLRCKFASSKYIVKVDVVFTFICLAFSEASELRELV